MARRKRDGQQEKLLTFEDLPTRVSRAEYEEAISRYSCMVQSRVIALYAVGNIAYPGLSDLDLLVVLDESRIDNNQFFAFERLPRRFHKLFLHQPFFVPADMTFLVDYTTLTRREYVTGADVLNRKTMPETAEARYCRFFESFCHYRGYVDRIRRCDRVSARMMIAVASAFRYSLADSAWPIAVRAEGYGQRIDDMRAQYFERGASAESRLQEVWSLLSGTVDALEGELQVNLPLEGGETAVGFAKALIAGRRELASLDRGAIAGRNRAILSYHDRLMQLRLSYGHFFYLAAHLDNLRIYRQAPMLRRLMQARYKPERLINELSLAVTHRN